MPGSRRLADNRIRDAQERGEFDNLPGAGKPIPDIDEPYDPMWWIKKKVREEGVNVAPPGVQLQQEVEDALAGLGSLSTEKQVRELIGSLNKRIRRANAMTIQGPMTTLTVIDEERAVQRWRQARGIAEE
jgi:hypothetical protein